MTDDRLRDEVNKRLTLNWLIQGAAAHAGLTCHHLVRDALNALHPQLMPLYDQYALINLLQYWHLEAVILFGRPRRFWERAATDPRHPFFRHPLLSRHGGALAAESRRRGLERCKEKGLTRRSVVFMFQVPYVVAKLQEIEKRHPEQLIELAKYATTTVWGIPSARLNATLTTNVAFGNLSWPRTLRGLILRATVVGYGGVTRRDGTLEVTARAANWQLLAKELVKGTAELVCLHGLNTLDDAGYRHVTRHADRIEFEPWMLQSGGELWRRLLAVLPEGRPVAEVLMHLARLPARPLEALMLAVVERPEWARELLASLGQSDAESGGNADDGG